MPAYLKVITGPMFSGKTEELLRILHRSELAGKKILVLKPRLDTRTANEIASRRKPDARGSEFKKSGSFPARPVATEVEARQLFEETQPSVLGIDEAQFFDNWLINFVNWLLSANAVTDLTILVAGLDMDACRQPFGVMPHLLAIAD
jgi:thymidine kinase